LSSVESPSPLERDLGREEMPRACSPTVYPTYSNQFATVKQRRKSLSLGEGFRERENAEIVVPPPLFELYCTAV